MNAFRVGVAIETVLAILYTAGWSLLYCGDLQLIALRLRLRHRLRLSRRKHDDFALPVRYVRNLLGASFQNPPDERIVFIAMAAIFVISLFAIYRSYALWISMIISIGISCSPALFLALKLEFMRKRGSKEGLYLISELHRHYWTNHKNIYSAIEGVLAGSGDYPVFKKLLATLLLKLRTARGSAEVNEAIRQYTFSAGTIWGTMLGICIKAAVEKGMDISDGLMDISNQLTQAHKRAYERDRLNSESARMTLFLVPLLYIATMWMSKCYLGLSAKTLLLNQFTTPEGILLFSFAFLLFVANITLLEFLRNQKIDY